MQDRALQSKWSYVLGGATNILVVDDDPILREFASVYLSGPDTEIVTAAEGEAALGLLRELRFDIALIDIEMPGMDGFALVERIRAEPALSHLPVVMLTGREDIASIDRAYQVGATAFSTKPVNWRQLSYQLRYVIRTSQIEAEARAGRAHAEELVALKTNLLNVMRHELRTPLSAIIGFADLIAGQHKNIGGAAIEDYARTISQAGRDLLDKLLDMAAYAELASKAHTLREDEYALSSLVSAARQGLGANPSGGPEIEIALSANPSICCDRERFVRLLHHVLGNAVRHSGARRVVVTSRLGDEGELWVSIADQGSGISAERLASCLALFEQGELSPARISQGLGIGLPLACRIAEAHGGSLSVESAPGAGTTVHIRLPRERVVQTAPRIASQSVEPLQAA